MEYIRIFISLALAQEYDRRRKADALSCQILRRFPTSSTWHDLPLDLAELMRQDAYTQGWSLARQHRTPVMKSYRALVRQIERKEAEIKADLDFQDSAHALRWIIHAWVRRP